MMNRIWRQFLHDKRTLALMLIAPLLILTLVALVFNGNTYKPKIGTVHCRIQSSKVSRRRTSSCTRTIRPPMRWTR